MKKQTGILLVIVLLIIAGIVFFYYRSLQTSYGTIIISASPPVNPVSTAEATPSPTTLSPEEQDKLPGGMFERTATDADYVLAGINVLKDTVKDVIALHGQPRSKEKGGALWHYPDFDVGIDIYDSTGILLSITVYRSIYKTARGIGVGDSVEELLKKYGIPTEKTEALNKEPLKERYFFGYVTSKGFKVLFYTENGMIKTIKIYDIVGSPD